MALFLLKKDVGDLSVDRLVLCMLLCMLLCMWYSVRIEYFNISHYFMRA
ncbi:MAG: hypothetical protein HN826_04545 [Methylococcales bacterium]|nr:hypothetical protein [Methylococcales bacterium]